MLKRNELLSRWGSILARYPKIILLIAVIVLIISSIFASHLRMDTQWSDMLPQNDPMVKEFDAIIHEYTNATNSIIVVEGEENKIKDFAEDIVPELRKLKQYVGRVEYKINKEFFTNHGLMLTKAKDIKNIQSMFNDLGLIPLIRSFNPYSRKYCT